MSDTPKLVKDVYVEEDRSSAKLVVEHIDQTKYSAYYMMMRSTLISERILFRQLTEC
jgi:hypothetical protein